MALLVSLSATLAQPLQNVIYHGVIKGYTTQLGFTTGKVFNNSVETGLPEMHLIHIAPDGAFTVTFPLAYGKECFVSFPFFNALVYFEPGAKVVQHFDVTDVNHVVSEFTGDLARQNNDMNKVRPLLMTYDADQVNRDIYQMTPAQFKAYFLAIQAQKIIRVDSVRLASGLDTNVYRRALAFIRYGTAGILTQYNYMTESAHRIKNHISFQDRKPVLPPVTLDSTYFDFLQTIPYNDSFSLTCGEYHIFINRLKFLDIIMEQATAASYDPQINSLLQKKKRSEAEERQLQILKDLKSQKGYSLETVARLRPQILQALTRADITLELELMQLQDVSQDISGPQMPMPEAELDKVRATLTHKYLLAAVERLNDQVRQTIAVNKTQTGYTANPAPVIAADSAFTAITNKYKGKVIFVDFWATWCEPCLDGIETMAPLKETLKKEDIVFLYITNESSPITAYNNRIPRIKGEHYRVSNEAYERISHSFGIYGIPYYAIVNKQNAVVDKDFKWADVATVKARLMQLVKE